MTTFEKLISFLLLENRTVELNTIVGYLATTVTEQDDWSHLLKVIMLFDHKILDLSSTLLLEDKVKAYCLILNKCYSFINVVVPIQFLQEAPFDDSRVVGINNYIAFIDARKYCLNMYK
jgi:hypothetical protein